MNNFKSNYNMITFLMIVNSYFLSNLKKEMFFSVGSRSLSFHVHYIRTKMDPSFLSRYHTPQQGDYFFDRDPDMFKVNS